MSRLKLCFADFDLFYYSPVDCIYWVTAAQLSLLEDEMRRVERVNVSVIVYPFFYIFVSE